MPLTAMIKGQISSYVRKEERMGTEQATLTDATISADIIAPDVEVRDT